MTAMTPVTASDCSLSGWLLQLLLHLQLQQQLQRWLREVLSTVAPPLCVLC